MGGKKEVSIKLAVRNDGTVNGGATAPATVIGVQNEVEVYNQTLAVSDAIGDGKSRFNFPTYAPGVAGTIGWTVTIADEDPDIDEASATTDAR